MARKVKLITETSFDVELNEGKGSSPYIVGIFSSVESRNQNERIYPKDIFMREYSKIMEKVESRKLFGELSHPETASINPERIAILVENLEWKGNDLLGKAKILDTPMGNIVKTLVKEGTIGISSRGLGTVNEEGIVNDNYNLITWDIVIDPSNPTSWVKGIYEGKEFTLPDDEEEVKVDEKVIVEPEISLEEAKKEYTKHIWQVIKEIEKNM